MTTIEKISPRSIGLGYLTVVAVLILVAGAISYIAIDSHRTRVANERQLAADAADRAATSIRMLLTNLRRTVRLLADIEHDRLRRLTVTRNTEQLARETSDILARNLADYDAFDVADQNGILHVDIFEETFGTQCREDIAFFAATSRYPPLRIHPSGDRPHFDIQVPWQASGQRGYLLVTFTVAPIQRILQAAQTVGQQLVLVRQDQPDRIELSAANDMYAFGTRLSDAEQRLLADHGAFVDLETTGWRLVAYPTAARIESHTHDLVSQLTYTLIAFLILALVVMWTTRREYQLRRAAQTALVSVNEDLEQRVRIRTEQLSESEKINRLTFEKASVAIAHVSPDMTIIKANDTFCRFLQRPCDELTGSSVAEFTYPADRDFTLKAVESMLQDDAQTPTRSWEKRYLRKDGSAVWGRVNVSLIRDANNEAQFFITVIEDIDLQKRAESGLLVHKSELESLVETRTLEVEAARKRAEQLANAKSEFLANMSHEIRTPLNAVLGLAQIGQRRAVTDQGRKTFDNIMAAGEHLLGVINDILDFSKIEAGKLSLDLKPLNLVNLVNRVVTLQSTQAKAKHLALRLDLKNDLPKRVIGDRLRLQQILLNLLANAVKFTNKGNVTMSVAPSEQPDTVLFEVTDTGIGMSGDVVSRLFKPFEQADSSTTRRFGGSGLGLTITAKLIRMMNGTIDVTSEPDKGSRFTVQIPLPAVDDDLDFDAEPSLTLVSMGEQRLIGLRILAVDDVDINRLIVQDMLEHEGAIVTLADDGMQALEQVRSATTGFDVVLMDVQMPGMDGYEATRRLHQIQHDLPVIALTAHALEEERNKSLAAGMVNHVNKPVDIDATVAAILGCLPSTETIRPTNNDAAGKEAPVSGESESNIASSDTLIDREALLARFGGRIGIIRKLIDSLLQNQGELPDRLRQAAAGKDLETLRFTVHTLKGMAGNLMITPLQSLAAEVESGARAEHESVLAQVELLATIAEQAFRELASWRDSLQPTN